MEFLLAILILVFDVAAIVDAIRGRLAIEKKILWILLILFLPVLGMILYFLLGRPEKAVA